MGFILVRSRFLVSAGIIGVQIFNGGLGHQCAVLYNPRPECAGCNTAGGGGPGDLTLGGIFDTIPIYENHTERIQHGEPSSMAPCKSLSHAPPRFYRPPYGGNSHTETSICPPAPLPPPRLVSGLPRLPPGNFTVCPSSCTLPDIPLWRYMDTYKEDRCSWPRVSDYPRAIIGDKRRRGRACRPGWWCVATKNPDYGFTSYDNILWAWLNIFNCITMTNWTSTMYMMQARNDARMQCEPHTARTFRARDCKGQRCGMVTMFRAESGPSFVRPTPTATPGRPSPLPSAHTRTP